MAAFLVCVLNCNACYHQFTQVYSMLLESPDNVCTIKVKSTESIGTMLDRISNTLSELHMHSNTHTHTHTQQTHTHAQACVHTHTRTHT